MTSSSVAAVCAYCGSTVARTDEAGSAALRNLGKISALVEDGSPLCLAAQGELDGTRFEIVGRIQLAHATGTWNEWFLHFSGGSTGWLGEALGQYFATRESRKDVPCPPYDSLKTGAHLGLLGKSWTVAEHRRARCTGGEGELPFAPGKGYELPYADLRGPDASFATIDYSEEPPALFVGRSVLWDELHMKGHREFHGW
jgi:hypothetical protein